MMPGELVFAWKPQREFWAFISFIPHRTQERFAADVGWSRKQRFPWSIQRPTTIPQVLTAFAQKTDECMVDFADLLNCATGSGVFFGWDVWRCSVPPDHPDFKKTFIAEDLKAVTEEEARSRSDDAAVLAITDIQKYAMPFIESSVRAS